MTDFIMIDLETLGATPGCAIIAIGAVAYSTNGTVRGEFSAIVHRPSCADAGLFEEDETVAWWDRQSADARRVLELADDRLMSYPVYEALERLNAFVRQQPADALVYGNGSDFDNAILAAAARAVGVKLAWPFWRNACYRTVKRRTPWVPMERTGTHHNALDDARSQAQHLVRLLRAQEIDARQAEDIARFVGWIADRYQERTARTVLGFRFGGLSRDAALDVARETYDAAIGDGLPERPTATWSRGEAADLADEDLQHWEGQ